MQTRETRMLAVMTATLMLAGCDEDRMVEMAERHLQQQAEQTQRMAEMQSEVAEGARQLVEADAEARQEMIALQRDVQAERSEVGRQRDALETERRALAARRRSDPIIAAAITQIGLLVICVLPLVLALRLVCRRPGEDDGEALVNEVLLEELTSDEPRLLAPPGAHRRIGYRDESDSAQEFSENSSEAPGALAC